LATHGLKASERIKRKKKIERIFKEGKVFISESKKLRATFLLQKSNNKPTVQFGVAVHKKAGSAVWRNRLKRLIREAYRKNKTLLSQFSIDNKLLIYLIISPSYLNQSSSQKLSLSDIEPVVIKLIIKVVRSV
jgi:ribonuclease P protein component